MEKSSDKKAKKEPDTPARKHTHEEISPVVEQRAFKRRKSDKADFQNAFNELHEESPIKKKSKSKKSKKE